MTDPYRLDKSEDCSDLEYDLAHEAVPETDGAQPATAKPTAPTYVATETDYEGGDYGYDLAHDIPKP